MLQAIRLYFKELPDHLKQVNVFLLIPVYLLVLLGITFIYGTGAQTRDVMTGHGELWQRQLLWAGIGTGLAVGMAGLDYRLLKRYAALVYAVMLVLLILLFVPGLGVLVNGARSWLRLIPGFLLQPSEGAKLGTLIAISAVAGQAGLRFNNILDLFPYAVITAIPSVLIILQPDLGSAMVLAPICIAILLASGAKWRWFIGMGVCGMIITPVIFQMFLMQHQRDRVLVFLQPIIEQAAELPITPSLPGGEAVIAEYQRLQHFNLDNWNLRQSLLAVGSGGLWGKGYMKGTQNPLGFLPRTVAPTDFIFSVISEESGFVGCVTLVTTLSLLVLAAFHIATKAADPFGRNLAVGIATLYAVHGFINIGMTIGVLPIIGIPLPFVSYGGSFMLMMMLSVGVLQSVHIHQRSKQKA